MLRHRYDEDEAKERKKKRGKHGDVDEMDFDEVWQDDEEMPAEMPGFEDDAKDDVGALESSKCARARGRPILLTWLTRSRCINRIASAETRPCHGF